MLPAGWKTATGVNRSFSGRLRSSGHGAGPPCRFCFFRPDRPILPAGNSKPLRPQRLYFIFSYRLSAGLYFTFKLLTKFCVAKRIAGFAFGVKAKSSMLSFVVRIAEAGSALRYVSYIVFRKLSGVCGLADCGLPKRALRFPLRQGLRRDRSLRVRLPFCCYYNPY